MYDSLKIRGNIILAVMALVLLTFVVRLFFIQVLNEEYRQRARKYVIKQKAIVPPRGNIYNRYGNIYVSNSPIFDMKITPRELEIPDSTFEFLLKELDMSRAEAEKAIEKARNYSTWKESIFAQYVEPEKYSILQEKLWNCRGISFTATTKREYKVQVGANILGYISEVSAAEIAASNGQYLSGDFIGKAGIERRYDSILRGKQGVRLVLKDVHNREVGSYKGGALDIKAQKGKDIMLGIDTDLQQYGEQLMANKMGSIVAIEPQTGEILAFVSAPSYEPRQLTGRELRENWRYLSNDPLKPLYNRPLQAEYPPGSIFKLANALAALNEGIITPATRYSCGGGFWRNGGKPGCRLHAHPQALQGAIMLSCNSYFAATYMDFLNDKKFDDIYQSYNTWYRYMAEMGIGQKLNIDLPYESDGLLPTTDRYDNAKYYYGKNRWGATNIISNAIGQGEILMTPLQMANMVALIANRGYYIEPHLVRATKGEDDKVWQKLSYKKVASHIDRVHFETVAEAMERVVANGTGRRAYLNDIAVCGKTGTVQNPHGEDHAVFVAFAPKDKPRIAIAVIIENAGGGGSWAAPAAGAMIEKYLRGEVVQLKYQAERVRNASFIPTP
ncbi:MAG: penicillin-binding protein 2 [Bacteroidetes bacterium]|nr:MAG: penicillin-binding protein 2 [Bacteroidota bacterium]